MFDTKWQQKWTRKKYFRALTIKKEQIVVIPWEGTTWTFIPKSKSIKKYFLTRTNFSLQILRLICLVLYTKNSSNNFNPQLLPSLAFPLSMFVGSTFWALYAVDRELVFPKALDEYFPSWLNHVMHTNIMILISIELFTSFRKYPTRKLGMSILAVFMASYLVWIHVIHSYSNFWVYPVLDVLNFPMRLVFFASLLALVMFLYLVGEKLNNLIWEDTLCNRHRVSYSKSR